MGSLMTSLLVPFANAGDGGTVALVVWAVVTLVASVALYVACPSQVKPSGPRGPRAFFALDRLCAASVVRLLYLVGAVGGLLFFIASVVVLFMGGYVEPPVGYVAALLALTVVYEAVLRIVCELVMLAFRLSEGVAALRDDVAGLSTRVSQMADVSSDGVERMAGGANVVADALAPLSACVPALLKALSEGSIPRSSAGGADACGSDGQTGDGAPDEGAVLCPAQAGLPVGQDAEVVAEVAEPPMAVRYEEIPAVFDATTYDEYASRGAFGPYAVPEEEVAVPVEVAIPPQWPDAPAVYERLSEVPESGALDSYAPEPAGRIGYGFPAWDCVCGSLGNTGAFCGNCGRPRPL